MSPIGERMTHTTLSSPVLSADRLVRTFRTGSWLRPHIVAAVQGVSLELHASEILAIVGESGSGKSTLARMLVGLETPTSGQLHVRGALVNHRRSAQRRIHMRDVQMVFQDPYQSLDPRMTVTSLVTEPLAVRGRLSRATKTAKATSLLGLVGLGPDSLSKYPHQFSGGQRQRIGIARALATELTILICDEPVSALDLSVQAQVINVLLDIRDRLGVAIVFISHDLGVVQHVADRVAVMYGGHIVETGRTAAIFAQPTHSYTRTLLSAIPTMPAS